jgi:hypothetical protein
MVRDNKDKTIVGNVDENSNDTINNTQTLETELTNKFVDYYNNTDDVYPKDIDVNLTLHMLDMTYEQIEDLYGDKVPTAVELERMLTLGFAEEFYNATQATTTSYISTIFSNEVEKEAELKLRKDLARINEQAINGKVDTADADNYKKLLIRIFTDKSINSDLDYYYSEGFKAFVANVFCPAYSYSANEQGFTESEAKMYGDYLDSYECKVLADKLNGDRDQSLVEHGRENATGTTSTAFINRLISTITQLESYKNMTFIDNVKDIAGLGARKEVLSNSKSNGKSSNNSNNSSSKKTTKKEVSKKDMTKEEKKQADTDEKEIKEQFKEDNKKAKDRAEDRGSVIEAAIQSVFDGTKTLPGINQYIYVELADDAKFDSKNDADVTGRIKTKAKTLITVADNKTGYKIFKDAYAILYTYDKKSKKDVMTETMKNGITNAVCNALVEYSKKGVVTPKMVEEIGKFLGINDLEKRLNKIQIGLIQEPKVTIVPGLEGTYNPSDVYYYDENGNKVYESSTPKVTPVPGATTTPAISHEENGITYYDIPTPPPMTFGSIDTSIYASYSSANNSNVICSIADALNYTYGKEAAMSYLCEVREIIKNSQIEEIDGNVKSKC